MRPRDDRAAAVALQDRPVACNASAKGREQNRRMEIVVSLKRDEPL